MIDVCCMQEVRWRGYGAMMLRMIGKGREACEELRKG